RSTSTDQPGTPARDDNGRMGPAAGASERVGVTGGQVFTARLKGRPLLDGQDLIIGRIRDVVILPATGSEPPRALGLVVMLQRRRIFVSLSRIGEISVDGAHLLGGTVDPGDF